MIKKSIILFVFTALFSTFAMDEDDIESQIIHIAKSDNESIDSEESDLEEQIDEYENRFRIFYKNWPKDQDGNKLSDVYYRSQLIKRLKESGKFDQYSPIYELLLYNIEKMNAKQSKFLEELIKIKLEILERSITWKTKPIYEKVKHLSRFCDHTQFFSIHLILGMFIGLVIGEILISV